MYKDGIETKDAEESRICENCGNQSATHNKETGKTLCLGCRSKTGDAAPKVERVNHSVIEFRVRDAAFAAKEDKEAKEAGKAFRVVYGEGAVFGKLNKAMGYSQDAAFGPLSPYKLHGATETQRIKNITESSNGTIEYTFEADPKKGGTGRTVINRENPSFNKSDHENAIRIWKTKDAAGCDICGKTPASEYKPARDKI